VARGYVDGRDAAVARGAHRDSGHARRGRALAPASAKEVKGGDDDDYVIVTNA
jgi:hypothetical protein